jgi:predicted dehydrogenase
MKCKKEIVLFLKNIVLLLIILFQSMESASQNKKPLRIGIAGLTHTHVHWIFNSALKENIEIVGIAEPNRELAERYAKQYGFPMAKIYSSLKEMLVLQKPEAVAAFNSIADHLDVVETCAPMGIHIMVEKPLAVSLEHAKKMEALAKQYKVHLLTNYETTWYSSVHRAYKFLSDSSIGSLRKLLIYDGHKGPQEIGVDAEFLDWLTDPVRNGGGAVMDFGCYGAVLSSWLMKGERPISVTAVVQQIKPEVYPMVDDEATVILTYPSSQTIIQASWNWPFSRKDMELYGTNGYVKAIDGINVLFRNNESKKDSLIKTIKRDKPFHDPFSYFHAIVRAEIIPPENDLSSLSLNMIVMEILDAALRSAREKKTIFLRSE